MSRAKTPSTKNPAFFGGQYAFVTPSDMEWKSYRCLKTARTVTEEARSKHSNQFIPKHSTMVTCIGNTIGKCGISTSDCLTNQQINSIVPSKGIDPFFVYYLLINNIDVIRGVGLGGGAATPILNKSSFSSIKLKTPPKSRWEAIASILSVYDDLIENNRRRIQLLEKSARLLFEEWFIRLRFPGHEHVDIVDGVPEGWKKLSLSDVQEVLETGNRPKGGVAGIVEGVPSIGAESIVGAGQFDFSKTKYVPETYFLSLRKGVVQDRDVLVYKDGGRPGHFTPHISFFGDGFPFERMALNSHVYRLRGSKPVSQEFLYYHLSSEPMMNWMNKAGSGAAIPGIARKDLLRLPVLLPTTRIMELFTEIASDTLTQILTLARTNRKAAQARNLLLPRLMNGEIFCVNDYTEDTLVQQTTADYLDRQLDWGRVRPGVEQRGLRTRQSTWTQLGSRGST